MNADTPHQRWALALLIYAVTTLAYVGLAPASIFTDHTLANHFALQADAWLGGALGLLDAPPRYASGNDFALYDGRWFVVFPPFPALLLAPAVAAWGSPEATPDGGVFILLGGLGPALLFLCLERLRALGRTKRGSRSNVFLALLLAFGTVYFFSAVQGTVWFAAHVVSVSLAAVYVLGSLGAGRPLVAGLALGLAFATRAPLAFAFPLFVYEAWRVARQGDTAGIAPQGLGRFLGRLWGPVDARKFLTLLARFAVPVAGIGALLLALNAARFGDPFEFGYRYLTVQWAERIESHGLFAFHYLPKNLQVMFTSVPWWTPERVGLFQINGHGLALWCTSPFLFWLLIPKQRGGFHWALWACVGLVAVPTLLYQNTGWFQFGYRFSNDYALFLFLLLAVGGRRFGAAFLVLCAVAVAVNAFGAMTFERPGYRHYYFVDPTQEVLYQPSPVTPR